MRKIVLVIVSQVLITGFTTQMAGASEGYERKAYRTPKATNEQFRDANGSVAWSARGFCGQEAGNPHDRQTDYLGWSAFRQSGAWDDRYDCP